jgi:hypothetical protein
MTTREQLELAAKALKLEIEWNGDVSGYYTKWRGLPQWNEWNPATDSDDNFNLACDLQIDIEFGKKSVYANHAGVERFVNHDNTTEGRRAAIREAVLLVAAEMGRAMP